MNFQVRSSRHGEQDERHGGTLYWYDDYLPILLDDGSSVVRLRSAEIARLPIVCFSKSRVFDLAVADDLDYYNWVRDHAASGVFIINLVKHYWDDEAKSMRVYVEWLQRYRTLLSRVKGNAYSESYRDQFVLS